MLTRSLLQGLRLSRVGARFRLARGSHGVLSACVVGVTAMLFTTRSGAMCCPCWGIHPGGPSVVDYNVHEEARLYLSVAGDGMGVTMEESLTSLVTSV